jgi:hypothetical protein
MDMERDDLNALTQLVYLEPDGELGPADLRRLEAAAGDSEEIAETRRQLARMQQLLAESRIGVRPDFASRVMTSLPPTGWSTRSVRSWWAAAVVIALLGGSAALLTGLSAAQLEPASPFLAAMAAVGDMVGSSLAAGAGLIGASWRGIGLAMGEWLGASWPNAIAFGVLLVGVNLLLVRQLRRGRKARVEAAKTANRRAIE